MEMPDMAKHGHGGWQDEVQVEVELTSESNPMFSNHPVFYSMATTFFAITICIMLFCVASRSGSSMPTCLTLPRVFIPSIEWI